MTRLPATLCGQDLPPSAHVCAFFDSREQQYDVLVPYFQEGLDHGEQVISIFDAEANPTHIARVGDDIDVRAAVLSGQLRILTAGETYLRGGAFDADRMYAAIEEMLRHAADSPFPFVRTCAEMTWALRHLEATEELVEHEARVNTLVERHECTLISVYDVNLFSGQFLMDVLATHPYVLMGQTFTQNRYYVPPVQYLQKLLKRRAEPAKRQAIPA